MTDLFPTDYAAVRQRLESFDPARYGKTRNFLSGGVSRLSPYITHGVLSVAECGRWASRERGVRASEVFVRELAWREYFQRVWWEHGDALFTDLYRPQPTARRNGTPTALIEAQTGVQAIDAAVESLLSEGYLHNHERLWIAALTCNVGQAHWREPAWWLYYHLLDGDLASNTLGWQWVAGSFGAKLYYANQENINRYAGTNQRRTILDYTYDQLADGPIPEVLTPTKHLDLTTPLPETPALALDAGKPLLLYHAWSLDPKWHEGEEANRVLVLEPSHFAKYPMSEKRIGFLLDLASKVPGLQIYCGEAKDLPGLKMASGARSKAHPATRHFPGVKEQIDWLFEWPSGRQIARSFSGYWNVVSEQARDFG